MKAFAILYKHAGVIHPCVPGGWTACPNENWSKLCVSLDIDELLSTVKGDTADPERGVGFFLYEFEVEVDEK